MATDSTIVGFLGRALSFEFSAVQQYLSLAALFKTKGLTKESEKFRHEADEEMGHAERIIHRLIALGYAPGASQLRPPVMNGSIEQLLQGASRLEGDIIKLYQQAVAYCSKASDHENRIFFEALLKEEMAHQQEVDSMLNRVTNN